MLRSNLSVLFNAGILVAGLVILPLSVPSNAKAETANNYQLTRHGVASADMNYSVSQMLNDYQLGRHNPTATNMMDAGKSTASTPSENMGSEMDAGKSTASMPKENTSSETVNDYQIRRHG